MGGRRTNLALLALLVLALASGTLAYGLGAPSGRAVVVAHGVAGLGTIVLSPWKAALTRRSLRRRPCRATWPSVLLAVLVVLTVVSGLGHSAGVRRLPIVITAMHLHVGAALTAIPFAMWHVVARPQRLRRQDATRRSLLRAGALGVGAGALWLGGEGVQRLAGLRGARRRFTGSHEEGTDDPPRMPVIQWLTDEVQQVDPRRWELSVTALRNERTTFALVDLPAARHDVRATIDCTSGWYATQTWQAVPLRAVLPADLEGVRSVVVRSVTGYARRFPVADLADLWLADGYAGHPLAAAHGAPVRLVAPGRRGFWWVKWVTAVQLDDAPWWRQPPFPLQ
jgi:DMSO/TMAO reductase YedYZ molybdopterin-dependent catalytic subunit